MLHYLIADEVVDANATRQLTDVVGQLIASGMFDKLGECKTFHAISMSRMGYDGSAELADDLFKMLKERGLAKDSEDRRSIPLHPLIRYLLLTLLAQILSAKGRARGLGLLPATDRPEVVQALQEVLDLPPIPSTGRVVAFDLQSVSVNLSAVPLDEVLAFRSENLIAYRSYARSVRKFARELSLLSADERKNAEDDRRQELNDLASDLRQKSSRAWHASASIALGLAGAAWTYTSGDPLGGLLAAGAGLTGSIGGGAQNEAGAYSYLFSVGQKFG